MINRQNSKILLKKIVEQKSLSSKHDSFYSLQLMSKRNEPSLEQCTNNKKVQPKQQPKYTQVQECTFNCNSKGASFEEQLQLQSRVLKQIDCLCIQSRIVPTKPSQPKAQIIQLPLECIQSQMHAPKIKVHSSIDGMETSKNSQQQSKEQSLPISDLILCDNKYMKLSNQLNQHENYLLSTQIQNLTLQYFQGLKLLKQQTIEKIGLIEAQLELIEKDELVRQMQSRIFEVQTEVDKIKTCSFLPLSPKQSKNKGKSRSKTPEIQRIRSVKGESTKIIYNEQNLERRILNQRQKMSREKQRSIKVTQKLSKAKSDYKKLQYKLTIYEAQTASNLPLSPRSKVTSPHQKSSHKLIPLSPQQKPNARTRYYQFLQKQKVKYYNTLKQHIHVIYEEIQTFAMFQNAREEQLKREIDILKNQIKYLDVKGVEKCFFSSPSRKPVVVNKNQCIREESSKKQFMFKNNYSQKLIGTYSMNSLTSGIPPLSPKSPQLHTRSPNMYCRSPQVYSPTSITPRVMKLTTAKKLSSNTSTTNSQTRMQTKSRASDDFFQQKKCKQQKQNLLKDQKTKKLQQKIKRKQQRNTCLQTRQVGMIKNRKPFANIINNMADMRTEPSDDYCINSDNQFRF